MFSWTGRTYVYDEISVFPWKTGICINILERKLLLGPVVHRITAPPDYDDLRFV